MDLPESCGGEIRQKAVQAQVIPGGCVLWSSCSPFLALLEACIGCLHMHLTSCLCALQSAESHVLLCRTLCSRCPAPCHQRADEIQHVTFTRLSHGMRSYANATGPPLGRVLPHPPLASCLWQQPVQAVQILDMASLRCMIDEKPRGRPAMQMALANSSSSKGACACICEHCAGD